MIPPKSIVYLGGPMTGYENFNHDAFVKAAALLRDELDLAVHNPAKSFGSRKDLDPKQYLRHCQHMISESTAIIFLPGWTYSKGCTEEAYMAQALGVPRFTLVGDELIPDDDPLPTLAERTPNVSEWIDTMADEYDVELITLSDQRAAEIGLIFRGNHPIGVAYDPELCVKVLAADSNEEDAQEWFDFNTTRGVDYPPKDCNAPLFLIKP